MKELIRINTETGKIKPCGLCETPLILYRPTEAPEGWLLVCKCGAVNVPQWVIADAQARRDYLKNFKEVIV